MTNKELLYIEDAIGHEKNIISILEETINMLQDEELISFLKNEIKHHKNIKEKIMCTLKECS